VQSNEPFGTSGARVGHTSEMPGSESDTTTGSSVTFPVFVTVNVYVITSPAASTDATSATLSTTIDGDCTTGTATVSSSVTGGPTGGSPDTVAVFTTEPASTSACDTV
jgi:hypothetical protein